MKNLITATVNLSDLIPKKKMRTKGLVQRTQCPFCNAEEKTGTAETNPGPDGLEFAITCRRCSKVITLINDNETGRLLTLISFLQAFESESLDAIDRCQDVISENQECIQYHHKKIEGFREKRIKYFEELCKKQEIKK